MSVETAIYSILINDATVHGLVGNAVYPVALPQDTALPCIVYQEISEVSLYSCDGPVGLETARYQITAWAKTQSQAKAIANAVKAVFNGYLGTAGGTLVQLITIASKYDVPAFSDKADEQTQYGKAVDIVIHSRN